MQCLDETLMEKGDSSPYVSRMAFNLIELWLTRGKPPHLDTLLDLKVLVRKRAGVCDGTKIMSEIESKKKGVQVVEK